MDIHERLQSVYQDAFGIIKSHKVTRKMYIQKLVAPINMINFINNHTCFQKFYDCKDEIKIGYHGTSMAVLDSIITNGFLAPYQSDFKVANGQAYGKGVYVSPSIDFSLGYSKGKDRDVNNGVFIVTAYTMGITELSGTRKCVSNTELTADSYIGSPQITVLRGASQVIPLFALYNNQIKDSILVEDSLYTQVPIRRYYNQYTHDIAMDVHQILPNIDIHIIINLVNQHVLKNESNIQKIVYNELSEFLLGYIE